MKFILTAAFSLLLLLSTSQAEEKTGGSKSRLKGLLITGGCCHDYSNQKLIITEGLSQRVSIAWDIAHEGGESRDFKVSVYSKPDWAKKYDVIVHNECFGAVTDDEFVRGIAAAHHEGVPAVFIHCSMHSYRSAPVGADSWRELIGVTSRRHEKQRSELVKTINAAHPVMKGFPAEWKTPNGELYVIEKHWPNCVPLAQAFGPDTQQENTVIWLNTFGKARVFGTTLGHHNETMNTEEWLGVVSRGLLWTVNGLDEDGRAKSGFEGTGVKPIVLPKLKPEPEKKS